MNQRERILQQIRQGRPMSVGGGGSTVRPTDQTAASSEAPQEESSGARIKPHRWGC